MKPSKLPLIATFFFFVTLDMCRRRPLSQEPFLPRVVGLTATEAPVTRTRREHRSSPLHRSSAPSYLPIQDMAGRGGQVAGCARGIYFAAQCSTWHGTPSHVLPSLLLVSCFPADCKEINTSLVVSCLIARNPTRCCLFQATLFVRGLAPLWCKRNVIHKSMSLQYEPASEPLHISVRGFARLLPEHSYPDTDRLVFSCQMICAGTARAPRIILMPIHLPQCRNCPFVHSRGESRRIRIVGRS